MRLSDSVAKTISRHYYGVLEFGDSTYRVAAAGREREGGRWEGWFEFIDVGDGTTLVTDVETTQPNERAFLYWATGIEPVYLEGALGRARAVARIPI